MKKTLTHASFVVAMLMMAVGFASAGNVNMYFVNGYGPTYPGTPDITYPYTFTINSSANQQLMCLDFNNNISPGQSWVASYSAITTSSPLIEQQSAWLFLQGILGYASTVDANGALWYLNDGGTAPTLTPGSATLIADLTTSYTSAQIGGGKVIDYVPLGYGPSSPQRFLGYNTATPEPGTLMMLGTGVLGLAGVVRRKLIA